MLRIRGLFALCAVVLGLAACGEFTASGDPLTEAEVGELAAAIANEGFVGFGDVTGAPAAAPGATSEPALRIMITLNESVPCDGGGTATVVGTMTADINEQTQTGTFEFDYTLTPHGCHVETESDDVYTLTGDPNLQAQGEFNWSPTGFDGSLNYEGKFKWETGDRAGACAFTLTARFQVSMDPETGVTTGTVTITGEICGVTVNRTVQFED
jgi:hypothetical protein